MCKTFYLDDVERDITEAKRWYAEQQAGLDVRFSAAVKETIMNIAEMPLAFTVRYKNVRIAHVKVFPYNVHFHVDEDKTKVIIIGIIHSKKRDAIFLDRSYSGEEA